MPIRPENRARYPKDWPLRSRFVRFSRAKNRCERIRVGPFIVGCGAENGKPHPLTGSIVVLTTAHVFDDRPEACSLLNLAAWCQRCHNRHDAKARQQRRRLRAGRPLQPSRQQQLRLVHASALRRAKKFFGIRPSPAERRRAAIEKRASA